MPKDTNPRDQPLAVELNGGRLVISIGIETLAFAIEHNPEPTFQSEQGDPLWSISDPDAFAREVVSRLNREEEDGTTPVHLLLDSAGLAAIENGSEGVEDRTAGAPDPEEQS